MAFSAVAVRPAAVLGHMAVAVVQAIIRRHRQASARVVLVPAAMTMQIAGKAMKVLEAVAAAATQRAAAVAAAAEILTFRVELAASLEAQVEAMVEASAGVGEMEGKRQQDLLGLEVRPGIVLM
jgi:hypothetical protein